MSPMATSAGVLARMLLLSTTAYLHRWSSVVLTGHHIACLPWLQAQVFLQECVLGPDEDVQLPVQLVSPLVKYSQENHRISD